MNKFAYVIAVMAASAASARGCVATVEFFGGPRWLEIAVAISTLILAGIAFADAIQPRVKNA